MEVRLNELIVESGGVPTLVPEPADLTYFEGCGYVRPTRPVVC
jgi:hypothetical protein